MKVTRLYSIETTIAVLRYFRDVVGESQPATWLALGLEPSLVVRLAARLNDIVADIYGRDGSVVGELDLSANGFEVLANLVAQRSATQDEAYGIGFADVEPLMDAAAAAGMKGFVLSDMVRSFFGGEGPLAHALNNAALRNKDREN